MKTKTSMKTGGKEKLVNQCKQPSSIHKELKAMVKQADYDLKLLLRLQKKVDPITADQMTVIYWDSVEKFWPDYERNRRTGEVLTKFRDAYPPLHRVIRFNGHEDEALVRVTVKKAAVETIYNVIAPALLKAGIKPFLIFNDNTFLVLPKDKIKARQVIARVG